MGNYEEGVNYKREKRMMGGKEINVIFHEMLPADDYDKPMTNSAGTRHNPGRTYCAPFNPRVFKCSEGIVCRQDVPVKMRDGITIYCDIYLPEHMDGKKIPALVSWSFYGKRPGDGMDCWKILGVPPHTVSKMSKFESPDPGYWCRYDYAVVNVDPRGVGHSEGDHILFGTQDGEDGYDLIEWLAVQDWCNGNVALCGNSCVAMTQWRIAAQQPPHLAAFCPWEGTSDIYRESACEGGIPAQSFIKHIAGKTVGTGYYDDMPLMLDEHPFLDEYWQDKIPDFRKITQPIYAAACWNHFHLRGTMYAFRKARSTKKWMRTHREFEWPDAYAPEHLEDQKRFLDRYCKNIYNGWELTPRYRIEVMDAYEFCTQTDRPEKKFPLERTEYKKLYLNAENGSMDFEPAAMESRISYDGNTDIVTFDYICREDMELTGYPKLHLWVSVEGYDDADIFVNIQKLDTKGEFLPVSVLGEPHPGCWGKIRVSRRKLDEKLSTDFMPIQSHMCDEKLKPGEIVPCEIEMNCTSRFWHKGQGIRVQICGRYLREKGWHEPLHWDTDNQGKQVIHTGGRYDSFLQIPVVPPRFQDGDILIR
ncbi:MAG: CocE/NonD family hydrolase [Lachnospiraceae bacterium]